MIQLPSTESSSFNRRIFLRTALGGSLLAQSLVGSLWAGYKSLKVKVAPAGTYPSHQQQGVVTIAADPYETREKIKTAFDLKELDEAGIVPVHIIVTNDGKRLTSPQLKYMQGLNEVSSDTSFVLVEPGRTVQGIGLKADPQLNHVQILKNLGAKGSFTLPGK